MFDSFAHGFAAGAAVGFVLGGATVFVVMFIWALKAMGPSGEEVQPTTGRQ